MKPYIEAESGIKVPVAQNFLFVSENLTCEEVSLDHAIVLLPLGVLAGSSALGATANRWYSGTELTGMWRSSSSYRKARKGWSRCFSLTDVKSSIKTQQVLFGSAYPAA